MRMSLCHVGKCSWRGARKSFVVQEDAGGFLYVLVVAATCSVTF